MAADDANYVRLLVESLTNLAADPESQLTYLGPVWDTAELAEDHVAPARNVGWLCDEGLISPRVRELAERITEVFDAMSGPEKAERWSEQALATDPGWVEIRAMAREALSALGSEAHR